MPETSARSDLTVLRRCTSSAFASRTHMPESTASSALMLTSTSIPPLEMTALASRFYTSDRQRRDVIVASPESTASNRRNGLAVLDLSIVLSATDTRDS